MGFTCCILRGFLLVAIVHACKDHFRRSLRELDESKFCASMSLLANCLISRHILMGSPFGANMTEVIATAVDNSVKQLCAVQCKIKPMVKTSGSKKGKRLFDVGNKLKTCALNAILSSGANKTNFCDQIEDVAKCFLAASTKDNYLMTQEDVQLSTYVIAEILKTSFQVRCSNTVLKERLIQKCRGRFQTLS